jgi:hypothetical protein
VAAALRQPTGLVTSALRLSDSDCAICFEALAPPTLTLPCGHSYHADCIAGLLEFGFAQTCPKCRADLPLRSVVSSQKSRVVSQAVDLSPEGIVKLVLEAMKENESPAVLVKWSSTLSKICSESEAKRDQCANAGATSALVSVLRTHATVAVVCSASCRELLNMMHGSKERKNMVVEAGGVPLLVAALLTHAKVAGVCEAVSGVLWAIAAGDEDLTALVAGAGAVPLLVAALRTTFKDAGVCERASGALRNMMIGCHERTVLVAGWGRGPCRRLWPRFERTRRWQTSVWKSVGRSET